MGTTNSTAGDSRLHALSQELASAVETAGGAVVAIHGRHRIPSSGVIWRPGVIVTASHGLKREEEITISLEGNKTATATLAGRDGSTDLAVLRAETGSAQPAFGDPAALKVGHLVLAVGRAGEHGLTAGLGIVSGTGGAWRTWRGGQIDQLIKTDIALYPGYSGGPLIDTAGNVLGINTAGLSRHAGLTIPVQTVDRVLDELLTHGRIARAYLGVGLHPVMLSDSLKGRARVENQMGLIVLSVEPGGPADKAGLLLGDILVSIDGTALGETEDVQSVLSSKGVNQQLDLSVIRGGELIHVALTTGERPSRRR